YIACEDILTLMDSMGLSENVNFADALVTVAGVYRDAGRLSESQRYYIQAFNIYEEKKEDIKDDLHYIEGCLGYGEVSYILGDKEKAIDYYIMAAETVKSFYGENETYNAIMNNIEAIKNSK
ncbi:MAG: tetratricopeptide repeat protein, partial [Butyrivibrio sp.]|nr:tetratricopeptide repeat protein [Butyrivibrio sp.]